MNMIRKTFAIISLIFPIKWAALAIPEPTTSVQPNYETIAILLCFHFLAAFRGVDAFQSKDHLKVIREVKARTKLHNTAKNQSSLNNLFSKISCNNRMTMLRGKELHSGCWPCHLRIMARNS
jgi:hypothetical protein